MKSSGGFKLEPFGKGRNAIQTTYANELVNCLNPLGNISIVRGKEDKVLYSDVGVSLQLGIAPGAAESSSSITVSESDGTPSVSDVTEIKFPSGSVTDDGGGVVTVTSIGSISVTEFDSSPAVSPCSEIKFPNGTVTDMGSGVAGINLTSMMRVKSIQADFITCRTWDGSTEGSTDIYVAKSFKLRNSITSAVIDGVTVTYTYPDTVTRTATIAGSDETQVIVPRFLVNDLLLAMIAGYTGVSSVTLIDLNLDGRAWSRA